MITTKRKKDRFFRLCLLSFFILFLTLFHEFTTNFIIATKVKERFYFMDSIVQQLLLQLLLILVNAFFAATEIAVLSLNVTKLHKLEEEGANYAKRLIHLVEEPSGFLSTIQVGITLAGFLGSALAADNFAEPLVNWIYNDLAFHVIPLSVLDTLSVILITLVLSYFTLVLGELVPKRIAMQKSLEVAKVASKVVATISVILKPVVAFLSLSTNLVLKILRMKTETEEETVTEEDILLMMNQGKKSGLIDSDEQKWIENVFEFDDISVKEAMTCTPDVVAIPYHSTDEEILSIITESGLSRFPVYDEDMNDILGILNTRDFLINLNTKKYKTFDEIIRPAYFVPETISAQSLFKDMQTKKVHIAVVVDEYGATSGIITMEDLIERIVGSIYDEFDPAETADIEQIKDNLWRVSGSYSIWDLANLLDIDIPEDVEYSTVGGMVFSCLHMIPKDGTKLDVDVNGIRIHVEQIEDHRIKSVLIEKIE